MKFSLFALALLALPALAQMDHSQHNMPMPTPQPQPMSMQHDDVSDFLMQQASGVATNPAAAPMHMSMFPWNGWMVMAHANVFANAVVQTGPRGADRVFSTNWFMGSAEKKLGAGHLMIRSMLSLEPLVLSKRGYPELFQTGETANNQPLVDRQHPHDFFMELAAEYAIDFGNNTIGYVYAAPVGDPALGPVAYPHRASALELPQATLAHHLQDSTHIADGVLTFGAKRGPFGLALSGFHGAEPDENRWNIDRGPIDSWSVRGTWDPTPNWTAQISTGHLKKPERLEAGNVQRTTASVEYATPIANGDWATSFIYGQNRKDDGTTRSWLAETALRFQESNYVTARAELVDKDELFVPGVDTTQRVRALTLGYTKDVYRDTHLLGGVGANVTAYGIPSALKAAYGSRPMAYYAYARVRVH